MAGFQIDDAEVQRVLAQLQHASVNALPAMRMGAEALIQRIRNTFRNETDPWGAPWQPHSPVTSAARARKGRASVQKLIDSGRMVNGIEADYGPTHLQVSSTGTEYERVQQYGNPSNTAWGRGAAPIPARPFFPLRPGDVVDLPPDWQAAMLAPIEAHLQKATA